MKFSWDENKARENQRKHGVSFTLAERALLRGLGVPSMNISEKASGEA